MNDSWLIITLFAIPATLISVVHFNFRWYEKILRILNQVAGVKTEITVVTRRWVKLYGYFYIIATVVFIIFAIYLDRW